MKLFKQDEPTNDDDARVVTLRAELAELEAEVQRRDAVAREEAEEEARREAERRRLAEIATLEAEYPGLAEKRAAAHADFGAALLVAVRALEAFREAAREMADAEVRFAALRATPRAAARVVPYSAEVINAAKTLTPVVEGNLHGLLTDPLRGLVQAHPGAFYPQAGAFRSR